MIGYLAKRLFHLIITFIIALAVIFAVPRLMPGDPSRYVLGGRLQPGTTYVDLRDQLVDRFGLNKSYAEQFVLFIRNTFQGYLGISWSFFPREVLAVMMERLPWTLFIMIPSRILSLLIGYFVGVLAAWKRGSKLDVILQFLGLTSVALPIFWLGSVILLVFSYYIPIFPRGGSLTPGVVYKSPFEWNFIADALYHAALPILTLAIFSFFGEALLMRNNMLMILGEDFIQTAEAKGLPERTIMIKHASRNAMLPLVTGVFAGLGGLIVGSIFVETVFSYPGLGQLMGAALFARDYPLVQGIFVLMTAITLIANLLADFVYMWLDPRIRLVMK
ncbi:MAG: ABC transporter permease [Nitrososphaerota archaeon]|nr:ABC transporter permease [Nitrososphaerota archaeon]